MVHAGSPSFIVVAKCQGASKCVPLWVERLISSTAQPSLSGKFSGFRPGKNWHMVSAVSACRRYSIFGPAPGGSAGTSFSSGTERSTRRCFTREFVWIIFNLLDRMCILIRLSASNDGIWAPTALSTQHPRPTDSGPLLGKPQTLAALYLGYL